MSYMWSNDIKPTYKADMSYIPYSNRCIRSKEDTVVTPVRMCAPELFAIEIGENYSISKVSPNPVSDYLNFSITVPFETDAEIGIYSTNGLLIEEIHNDRISKGNTDYKTNIETLPAGVYLLKVKAGLMNNYQKIVKVN